MSCERKIHAEQGDMKNIPVKDLQLFLYYRRDSNNLLLDQLIRIRSFVAKGVGLSPNIA